MKKKIGTIRIKSRNETGQVERRGDRARQGEIKRRGNGLVNRTPETSKFSPTRPLAKEDKNEKKNRYEIGSCNFFPLDRSFDSCSRGLKRTDRKKSRDVSTLNPIMISVSTGCLTDPS